MRYSQDVALRMHARQISAKYTYLQPGIYPCMLSIKPRMSMYVIVFEIDASVWFAYSYNNVGSVHFDQRVFLKTQTSGPRGSGVFGHLRTGTKAPEQGSVCFSHDRDLGY